MKTAYMTKLSRITLYEREQIELYLIFLNYFFISLILPKYSSLSPVSETRHIEAPHLAHLPRKTTSLISLNSACQSTILVMLPSSHLRQKQLVRIFSSKIPQSSPKIYFNCSLVIFIIYLTGLSIIRTG